MRHRGLRRHASRRQPRRRPIEHRLRVRVPFGKQRLQATVDHRTQRVSPPAQTLAAKLLRTCSNLPGRGRSHRALQVFEHLRRALVASRRVPLEAMMALAGPLEAVAQRERPNGFGPASVYRRPRAVGTLGFIAAVSGRFCETCNRVRVTSRGVLLPCLAAAEGHDLLPLLRSSASDEVLEGAIRSAVSAKPSGHAFGGCSGARVGAGLGMCGIGG